MDPFLIGTQTVNDVLVITKKTPCINILKGDSFVAFSLKREKTAKLSLFE